MQVTNFSRKSIRCLSVCGCVSFLKTVCALSVSFMEGSDPVYPFS